MFNKTILDSGFVVPASRLPALGDITYQYVLHLDRLCYGYHINIIQNLLSQTTTETQPLLYVHTENKTQFLVVIEGNLLT